MNDLRRPWLGPMNDKHHPRWVRRTVVSKRGLKEALVVVVKVVVVATTTATPSTFDTRTKVHLRLCPALRRPKTLGSLLRDGSGGNHHWVS